MVRRYPAKILLFGEYTVIRGSSAFAIPFRQFSGYWKWKDDVDTRLITFAEWMEGRGLEGDLMISQMMDNFNRGLSFCSTIPSGYGLGSSGALVAAIWDKFARGKSPLDYHKLREHFALIESYFHGKSSGLDPLVSFLQSPIKIHTDQSIVPAKDFSLSPMAKNLYLYNSHQSRKTEPLVQHFRKEIQKKYFLKIIESQLIPSVENAITSLFIGDYKSFSNAFRRISQIQFEYFKPMIPPQILPFWEEGLTQNTHYTKLCGAGGGGFFLVFNPSTDLKKHPLNPTELLPIYP